MDVNSCVKVDQGVNREFLVSCMQDLHACTYSLVSSLQNVHNKE